jgi:hypothetical protein
MISHFAMRSRFPLQRITIGARPPHSLRFLSVSPTSKPPGPGRFLRVSRKAAKYTAFTCFSAVLGLSVLVGGVFIHDVFTYSDKHIDRVPVSPLALHPECGGPRNLPIASVLVGDEDDDGALAPVRDKPRLVIVGGGWGVRPFSFTPLSFRFYSRDFQAVSVLKSIHPGDYHVTVVSPDTFTTFTPLLPCKSVVILDVCSP